MRHILAELSPLKITDGSRPVLRASSAQDRRLNGVAGVPWVPAISKRPTLGITLFDGDFTSEVAPGTASITIRLDVLGIQDSTLRSYRWPDAPISLYAVDTSTALNDAGCYDIADLASVRVFKGRVKSFTIEGNGIALQAEVETEAFEKDVLVDTYAGTGDDEGGEDLKDRLKPWIFGRALNVEPILINSVDNVVQFSARSIQGISALYERGADFGPSIGNFPTYAALVAATIPAGRWATCHARGMARLGAPPYGVITGDIDGDNGAGFVRTTGAIIRRVAVALGIDAGLIDTASLDALDDAVPYPINVSLTEQLSVLDLAQRLIRPCNAQAGIDFMGRLFAVRPTIGTPSLTLDALGRRMPPVRKSTEADVSAPYKRIIFGAARSWRVHTFDEIAFDSPLVDRGEWKEGVTYRRGNIVSLPNGSRWLYVSDTPKAGSYPAEDNPDWELMTGAITAGNITYEDGTPVEELKPAEPGATSGAPAGTLVDGITAEDVAESLMALGLATDPAEIVAGARALADAMKALALTTSADEIVAGAQALVDRARSADMAALEQMILNQERREYFDNLTHMEGVPVGAKITEESVARVEGDEALASNIVTLEAVMTVDQQAVRSLIQDEATARADADSAEALSRQILIAEVRTDVEGGISDVQSQIVAEAIARADADAAETAQRILAISEVRVEVDGKIDIVNAAIASEAITRANADAAETLQRTQAISTLRTEVDGQIDVVTAAISTEATTRASADAAETEQREIAVSRIDSDMAVTRASITSEATTRATADAAETLARQAAISSLQTVDANLNAAIVTEATTRATNDAAETALREAAISSLQSVDTYLNAALTTELTTRATADAAEASARQALAAQLTSDIADANAAIEDEATARATADAAETTARNTAISTLQTTVNGQISDAMAAITSEATTRASADLAETTARNGAISALTTTMNGHVTDLEAAIASEATTRATADAAETSQREAAISSLQSADAYLNAALTTEATTRASADAAEVTARQALAATLTSDIADVSAAVETEAAARVSADGAIASLLSAVQTTVDGHTAEVLTLMESVDGLSARWGVRITRSGPDGDPVVSGVLLNDDGEQSDFSVLADTFRVVSNGTGDRYEFGDGRQAIIGGSVMTITGKPFGSASQFIEWTGPIVSDLSTCTEANAIKFVKTSGQAYYAGGIIAGTLKASMSNPSLGTSASVTTGAIGSNGNAVSVNASYSLQSQQTATYPATLAGRNDYDAAIAAFGSASSADGGLTHTGTKANNPASGFSMNVLRESSTIGTHSSISGAISIYGLRPVIGDAPGYIEYTYDFWAAVTVADPSVNTASRTYSANFLRSFSVGGTILSQRISVTSTEW